MDLPLMNRASSEPIRRPGKRRTLELLAVVGFISINLLAPVLLGERYPFTVSPMFSDHPSAYCTYEIFDSTGQAIDLEPFGLHLVYDGNPPGLGMGIAPAPTLHQFGEVCDNQTVVDRVRQTMQAENIAGPLTVKRTHVEGGEPQLKTTTDEWIVSRDEAEADNP